MSVLLALALLGSGDDCAAYPPGADGRVEARDFAHDQCVPSPQGETYVRVRLGQVSLEHGGRSYPLGDMDGGRIAWRPDGRGFAIQDSEGSGQTARFRYVVAAGLPTRTSVALREAALARFAQVSGCAGAAWYANTWLEGWDGRNARLVVQAGVHSEGCAVPHNTIGVVGDPETGAIDQVLTAARLRRDWCTAERRREFGYCHEGR